MHKDLEDMFNRHLSKEKKYTDQTKLPVSRLQEFINFMIKVDRQNSIMTFQTRLEALQLAGNVCDVQQSLEVAFKQAGVKLDTVSQKSIKAFDKVANYRHISERLSRLAASSRFRHLFKSILFRFLDNYAPHVVQGRERFVHAEVQIVTFHRLQRTSPLPRTIGTTKAACYLCNLFLSLHPQYTISAAHGVIFDAWTIPDVILYSAVDRGELRAIVQSMQEALEARARKRNCRFLQFPIQSGIYHVPSLPSLAGTVIGPAASVETASISTVRTISRTQRAIAISSVDSLREAVAIPLSDRHAESPFETASQKPLQQCATADEQHSMDKESGLQRKVSLFQGSEVNEETEHRKVIGPGKGSEHHTEAKFDTSTEDREVSDPDGILNGSQSDSERVLFTGRPQMRCAIAICPEWPNLHREPEGKATKTLPHDADDGCTSIARRSSDQSDRLSSTSEPMQIQSKIIRVSLGEAGQGARESSGKRSRKKRRRRRHRVQSHPRSRRKDYNISRQPRSSWNKTYQGSEKRGYIGHGSREKYHSQSSKSRYSFLYSLWRVVRGTQRLFCR